MRYTKFDLIILPVLFLLLLVDGQLSTLLTNFIPGVFSVSTYLLFIGGLYFAHRVSLPYSLLTFVLLGLVYDLYYLKLVGLATTIFPLLVIILYFFFRGVDNNRWTNVIVLLVLIFHLELVSYLFARLFQLTNLSVFIFVFYNLLPTLVVNFLLFVVLQPLFDSIFRITNKT